MIFYASFTMVEKRLWSEAMSLSEEQTRAVSAWITEGATLAEVQRRLKEECSLVLTYMDVRLLVDDLKLRVKDQAHGHEALERLAAAKAAGETERAPAAETGGVRVTMDSVTRPSALASGKVTFSDGATADWMLDEGGRLGLNPATPGYRPSEADILDFQRELQRVAQGLG
jgi:hypothetical protein